MPTAVVAIGGNSLIADPKHQSVPDPFAATRAELLAIIREAQAEIAAGVEILLKTSAIVESD